MLTSAAAAAAHCGLGEQEDGEGAIEDAPRGCTWEKAGSSLGHILDNGVGIEEGDD